MDNSQNISKEDNVMATNEDKNVIAIGNSINDLETICRGCLSKENVASMKEANIEGIDIIFMYEKVTRTKMDSGNVPAKMCVSCMSMLYQTYKFLKLLHQSYEILEKSSKEVDKIQNPKNTDEHGCASEKTNIFNEKYLEKSRATNEEGNDLSDDDPVFSLNYNDEFVEKEGPCKSRTDIEAISSEFERNRGNLSETPENMIITPTTLIPLDLNTFSNKTRKSAKHPGLLPKDPECVEEDMDVGSIRVVNHFLCSTKGIPEQIVQNNNDSNTTSENKSSPETSPAPNRNSDAPSSSPTTRSKSKLAKVKESSLEDPVVSCPVCNRRVKYFAKHLRSIHSIDWDKSTCLKCRYQSNDTEELVNHAKSHGVGVKREKPADDVAKLEYAEVDVKKEYRNERSRCEECNLDFKSEEQYKRHLDYSICQSQVLLKNRTKWQPRKIRDAKKSKFTCKKCSERFNKFDEIEQHFRKEHVTESTCILCDQEFNSPLYVIYHLMVKHGKQKSCRLCLVSFATQEEMIKHYKSEEHNTLCTVCNEQFKNRKALYEHRRKKHLNPQLEAQRYQCPKCPKNFANTNNIKRHIMVAHNDVRFLCDTCGQSYTTNRNLQHHILKFHQGQVVETKSNKTNFFCEQCGKELKIVHKYSIALHLARHKGHKHVCKRCFESFATGEEFDVHVEEKNHKLFKCDKCVSQFVLEENLKTHMKNHDAPGWNRNYFSKLGERSKQYKNANGEFACSYCEKTFSIKQRLDNHVRVHTNERPYKCHICHKGFKTWIHRKTHLNIHLGIKNWQCQYCQKAFTNQCTLKGHEMIHTGERPHKCPECKKGFITSSAMKKHRQTHFRTGTVNYGKKTSKNKKAEAIDSENEEDATFVYRGMFANDISYEGFQEPKIE